MVAHVNKWTGGTRWRKALKSITDKIGTAGAVQVGFFEGSRYTPVHPIRGTKRKPLPVAQVAFWNLYGTKHTPARDFMGAAVRANQGYWPQDVADLAKAHGYDARKVLALMGDSIKDDIVHYITVWSQPPNSPRWAAVKGFNKPLIDDGTMQREVGSKVIGV